ncbi:MAG: AGE family epimerase/isomerase [Gammaproteobacteria bacterium]|nr:AGE family epimerase/isomerase [Gammaproteobacteria bacterium]
MSADPQHPAWARLTAMRARLVDWLSASAFPLWARIGIDRVHGGFVECVEQDGTVADVARRARVPARQIVAFAEARRFGGRIDAERIVARGLKDFVRRYRRADGLFRTLVAADGRILCEDALLYDQAFALLALAAAAACGSPGADEEAALALRERIDARYRTADGGFRSRDRAGDERETNPHMHLLEACQAWKRIGADPGWSTWCQDLSRLALRRFVHAGSGAIGEVFTPDWRPAPGPAGDRVEPGHQFEWAWLLLREGSEDGTARAAARRLYELAAHHGVLAGVAVDACDAELAITQPGARFWPQTERLKAALRLAVLTDDERIWSAAAQAAESFLPYLATPIEGLWFDYRTPAGAYPSTAAPASTLYHLVGAIGELDAVVGAPGAGEAPAASAVSRG